ncbi:MAG: contractile injection system protein, VgrG/Pvc8 family [Pseudomonadota bacterium]
MTPSARITVNGQPVAAAFWTRLIRLEITDNAGEEADKITVELADGEPFFEIPEKGAIISAALGSAQAGHVSKGLFTVDDVEVQCLPYKLVISGSSADLRKEMKEPRERHWDGKTLGDVVKDIAAAHGLTPAITGRLSGVRFPGNWLGQQDESDINLLRRLAERHGAAFTVKDGRLVFADGATGMSASGAAMGRLVVRPNMILRDSCRFRFTDRGRHKKVVAYTDDRGKQTRKEVEVESDGAAGAVYRLPVPFGDEDEARSAAEAKAKDLETGADTAEATLLGDATIEAGAVMVFQGVRPGCDGIEWTLDPVVNVITKRNWTTRVSGKRKAG